MNQRLLRRIAKVPLGFSYWDDNSNITPFMNWCQVCLMGDKYANIFDMCWKHINRAHEVIEQEESKYLHKVTKEMYNVE